MTLRLTPKPWFELILTLEETLSIHGKIQLSYHAAQTSCMATVTNFYHSLIRILCGSYMPSFPLKFINPCS